ncbi:MAG: LuxR C-terminal-related transcriptional regulator [Rhizomicrobium sp.]
MQDQDLLDTVGAFYAAAADPGGWAHAVEKLRVLCNADSANFGIFDPSIPTPVISANCGAWTNDVMDRYVRDFIGLDPAPVEFSRHAACNVISTNQLFSSDYLRTSAVYNEFLRPLGLTDCMGGRLVDISNGISLVSIHRDRERHPFSDRETAILENALPHMARAFQLRRLLQRQSMQATALAGAIDRLAVGLIVLDSEGVVLHVNTVARDIAARADGLRLSREGHLRALNSAADARLDALQKDVLAGGAGGIARAPGRNAARRYAVLVSPLPIGFGLTGGGERRGVILTIADPARQTQSSEKVLSDVFGLTARGAQLVVALVNGAELRDYAEQAGITLHTARFHLKSVFAKMDVRSQTQCVRLAVRTLAELQLR